MFCALNCKTPCSLLFICKTIFKQKNWTKGLENSVNKWKIHKNMEIWFLKLLFVIPRHCWSQISEVAFTSCSKCSYTVPHWCSRTQGRGGCEKGCFWSDVPGEGERSANCFWSHCTHFFLTVLSYLHRFRTRCVGSWTANRRFSSKMPLSLMLRTSLNMRMNMLTMLMYFPWGSFLWTFT